MTDTHSRVDHQSSVPLRQQQETAHTQKTCTDNHQLNLLSRSLVFLPHVRLREFCIQKGSSLDVHF